MGHRRLSTSVHRVRIARTGEEGVDILKRQPRAVLATPIRHAGADGLGILVARDVVAAEATVLADRAPRDKVLQLLRGVGKVLLQEQFLVGLELGFQRIGNSRLHEFFRP